MEIKLEEEIQMKRLFSPVRSDDKIKYENTGDKITVKHTVVSPDGKETTYADVFDFTNFPDGEAQVNKFVHSLPSNPFVSVKRVAGVLELVVINYHGANATEEEKFPEWEVI